MAYARPRPKAAFATIATLLLYGIELAFLFKSKVMDENRGIQDQSSAETTPPGNPTNIISEHIVKETDTLPEIASMYGISIDDLLSVNHDIADRREMMQPGTRILIPNKTGNG